MSSPLKRSKRCKRLIECVKRNDIKRLKHYVRKRKYQHLLFDRPALNRRQESLILLAARLLKIDVVNFLLQHSLFDPAVRDSKGNSALHRALKSVLKVKESSQFISVYKNMVHPLLAHIPISMGEKNKNGHSLEFLLEMADAFYHQHRDRGINNNFHNNRNAKEEEWNRKLAGELEDEYAAWSRYEEDFTWVNRECENYDSWAERILQERKSKMKSSGPQSPPKEEVKPSGMKEDQEKFFRDQEARKHVKILSDKLKRRMKFKLKLAQLVQKQEREIFETDLPFALNDEVSEICELIVMDLEDIEDDKEAKRKSYRELQRLWHPDKFSQKFGARLTDNLRPKVLQKITEISQSLNAYHCK